MYDNWFITLYNWVYTSLPVLGLSLFDQVNSKKTSHQLENIQKLKLTFFIFWFFEDVNDRWSLKYPQLYTPGQHNMYFSKKVFLCCMMHSCYSSLVLFFIPWAAMQDTVRDDGKDIADHQSFALLAQTCLLLVVTIEVKIFASI